MMWSIDINDINTIIGSSHKYHTDRPILAITNISNGLYHLCLLSK